MKVLSLAIAGFAAIALQTACSGGGSVPTVSGQGTARTPAKARAPLVYVADAGSSFIAVFDVNGTLVGKITDGLKYPSGIFVDGGHNLWVANAGHSNVLEFARGGTKPIATLPDRGAYTQDVTICPNGDIFVATLLGGITKYSGSRHHKAGSLYGGQFQFVTCDKAGNVFATGVVGTFGTVVEFPGGKQSGERSLPIYTPGNLGGIKMDNAGNILVAGDPGGTVAEYTENGTPTGVQIPTNGNWFGIALSRDGKTLLGANASTNKADSVSFPGGKPGVAYSDSFSMPWGVAFDPGQKGI
jgi:hypothetical protein